MKSLGKSWELPDLYLKVKRVFSEEGPVLDFQLTGTKLGRPVSNMGATPLGEEYDQVLQDIFSQWERTSSENSIMGGLQNSQLKQKGGRLFEILLPEALQKTLWDLRHVAHDLIIDSQEEIPWELLHLQDPHSNLEDTYLCLRFNLARWLVESGKGTQEFQMPALSFKMAPMALIQGQGQELTKASDEIKHLQTEHQEWKPKRVESSWEGIRKAMTSAQFRSWHFVGHGMPGENRHRDVGMLLESAEELKPEILTGVSRGAGQRRPLVFWNCCYSSRGSQFFGLRGWPETFVRNGFGAFIGTLWAVRDDVALIFSKTFYRTLQEGENLGECMLQARQAVKRSGSDDWLAYVLYGDPRATFVGAHTKEIPLEELWQQVQHDENFTDLHKPCLEVLESIREPVPDEVLAAFAGISEQRLACFLETWEAYLSRENYNRIRPRSELKRALAGWVKAGMLKPEEANWRIVTTLMREARGISKNLI